MNDWHKTAIMIIVCIVACAIAYKGLYILKTSALSDNAKTGWVVISLFLGGGALGIIAKWLDEK